MHLNNSGESCANAVMNVDVAAHWYVLISATQNSYGEIQYLLIITEMVTSGMI